MNTLNHYPQPVTQLTSADVSHIANTIASAAHDIAELIHHQQVLSVLSIKTGGRLGMDSSIEASIIIETVLQLAALDKTLTAAVYRQANKLESINHE